MTEAQRLRELTRELPVGVVFSSRPDPIPGDLRLSFRIPLLCVLLARFWGNKTSLECLHIMWWAIRTAETRGLFLRWHQGAKRPDELLVRYDPALTLTVDLALGMDCVDMSDTGAIVLAPKGKRIADEVWREDGVLVKEKLFMRDLPTLSQKLLGELTKW